MVHVVLPHSIIIQLYTINTYAISMCDNALKCVPLGHQMPPNGEEPVSLASSGLNPNVLEERGEVPIHARGRKLSREGEREQGRKPLHAK